jgi:glycosyltransferase involved in cell wall biosynthesis
VTAFPHYPEWRVDAAYAGRWRERERVRGVDVIRTRPYVPRRQSALRRGGYELSFLLGALAQWGLPDQDAVIGVVPTLGAGVAARRLACRTGSPYGLLFQDLVGAAADQSGMPGGGRVAGAVRRVEARLVRGAAAVAGVSRGFTGYLSDFGLRERDFFFVPNWVHVDTPGRPRDEVRRQMGWDAREQIVLHAGSIGLKQGLEQVVDAARLAEEEGQRRRFVLMGDGSERGALRARARGLRSLTFIDPQPEERFADVLAAADVLLVSERTSVSTMSLPSKLTSYLSVGRPVVAAVDPGGATAEEVERSGGGLVVPAGDARALLVALERLETHPGEGEALGRAGRAYADDELSRPNALRRAEGFIGAVVRGARTP